MIRILSHIKALILRTKILIIYFKADRIENGMKKIIQEDIDELQTFLENSKKENDKKRYFGKSYSILLAH